MSDAAAWMTLGPVIVAVLGGGVIVAVIQTLLSVKVNAERYEDLICRVPHREGMPVEDPLVALEASVFAPIEDAVREGEERAMRDENRRNR